MHSEKEEKKKNNTSWLIFFFFFACQTIYYNCWILISPWCLIWCSQHWLHALGDWTVWLSNGVKTWQVTALPTLWTKKLNPSKVIETVKMSTVLLTTISLITRFTCQHYFGVILSGLLWRLFGAVIYTSGSKVFFFFLNKDYPNLRKCFIYFQINWDLGRYIVSVKTNDKFQIEKKEVDLSSVDECWHLN